MNYHAIHLSHHFSWCLFFCRKKRTNCYALFLFLFSTIFVSFISRVTYNKRRSNVVTAHTHSHKILHVRGKTPIVTLATTTTIRHKMATTTTSSQRANTINAVKLLSSSMVCLFHFVPCHHLADKPHSHASGRHFAIVQLKPQTHTILGTTC